MSASREDRRARRRAAIPDPFADQATAPVDVGEMEAAARLSCQVADPDQRPHIVRRATSLSPEAGLLPHGELRVAGVRGLVRLPVHQVTRTGATFEVPADVNLTVAEGVAVLVALELGSDVNGQAIHARLPALVAHHRRGAAGKPGGISLRWDTRGPGVTEELNLLLARLGTPAT